ncbi:DUF1566 domain-containing protein [Leptospira kmetyi]|uniref:DUF1566 domain-containing protein n=1 Tax=Leptospira kmetyi TaxID=408139 RepID=A0ABX4N4T3_9LEPT|nr:DUF1566 domain-containing protein [Leptospira kmetyi]PJZ28195.1 hypothetical protein CH378_19015 [Leptospira kmetyi]
MNFKGSQTFRIFYHLRSCSLLLFFLIGSSACLMDDGKKNRSFFFFPSSISSESGTVPVSQPVFPPISGKITYFSANTIYLSGQSGAFEFEDIQWSSSVDASYQIRYGATNCSDGILYDSSSVPASTSITVRIHAISGAAPLAVGNNSVRICLFNPSGSTLWDSYAFSVERDDSPPTVSFSPSSGTFGSSAPNITISCSDSGNSGCQAIAYRADGTAASISNTGAAASGSSLYSSSLSLPNNTTTNLSAIAVDKAGNVGAVNSGTYVVSFGNPTITIVSLSQSIIKGTGSSVLRWKSDIAGNYSVRVGSTNCSDGTSLSSGPAAANTNIDSTILGSSLSAGSNTLRVCLTTAGSNEGNSTTNITLDNIAPQIIATSPALSPNATAFALSVTQRTFSLTFNEDMDTSSTPNPQHRDQTQGGDPEIKWPGAVGSWSADKRTYTLNVQSNLPEWHKFYLLYSSSSFKDIAGNVVASSPVVSVVSGNIKLNHGTIYDTRNLLPSDSRQTDCSDENGLTISCAGSGQDGESIGLPSGLLPPGTLTGYPSDYVTADIRNLRYWKTCLVDYEWNGTTCAKICAGAFKWNGSSCVSDPGNPAKSFNRSVEDCSSLNVRNSGSGYAGKTTWRVPTISEYYTILEYGGNAGNETILEAYFPGILRNNYERYWSSTNGITINASNRYGASGNPSSPNPNHSIENLSMGPIPIGYNYSNPSLLVTWGAWSVTVFEGITHVSNKLKSTGWTNQFNYTSLCISD